MRFSTVSFAVVLCSLLLSSRGVLAEEAAAGPDDAAKYKKFLKQLEGNWDATLTFAPNATSQCTVTNTMGAGGNWLLSDFSCGAYYSGHGVYGYDGWKKKCVCAWVDSTKPGMGNSSCELNASETVLTVSPDSAKAVGRIIIEVKDKDTHSYTFIGSGPDGKEYTYLTINCKRKQ